MWQVTFDHNAIQNTYMLFVCFVQYPLFFCFALCSLHNCKYSLRNWKTFNLINYNSTYNFHIERLFSVQTYIQLTTKVYLKIHLHLHLCSFSLEKVCFGQKVINFYYFLHIFVVVGSTSIQRN